MIQQIQLVLSPPNDVRIPQSWSYRLYGWLMSQISSEFGEQMHLQGEHPIAHFLCFSPEKQSLIWTVNLLNDAARQVVFPVLESAKEIPLHELTLPVSEVRTFPAADPFWALPQRNPCQNCFSVALRLQAVRPLYYFPAGNSAFAKSDCALERCLSRICPYRF